MTSCFVVFDRKQRSCSPRNYFDDDDDDDDSDKMPVTTETKIDWYFVCWYLVLCRGGDGDDDEDGDDAQRTGDGGVDGYVHEGTCSNEGGTQPMNVEEVKSSDFSSPPTLPSTCGSSF